MQRQAGGGLSKTGQQRSQQLLVCDPAAASVSHLHLFSLSFAQAVAVQV
jgi:hypothetical protein